MGDVPTLTCSHTVLLFHTHTQSNFACGGDSGSSGLLRPHTPSLHPPSPRAQLLRLHTPTSTHYPPHLQPWEASPQTRQS